MPVWSIYLFLAILLVACILLAREWYVQGKAARRFGEKLPAMLAFAVVVTLGSLAFDIFNHGFGYLLDHPIIVVSRFVVALLIQLIPYAIGIVRGRNGRGSGIIGMD